jgi:hypothetical protein
MLPALIDAENAARLEWHDRERAKLGLILPAGRVDGEFVRPNSGTVHKGAEAQLIM